MMSTRTQAVLALTMAGGPLLIANSAHAATSCGASAIEAVYATVHHAGVSHTEHRWWITVVDAPAVPAHDDPPVVVPATFTTVTVVDTEAFDEVVVDQEAWDETVTDQDAWTETVTTPAWTETVVDEQAWTETVEDHPAWDETVVDAPAQAAVYETLYKWVHAVTGEVRWEPLDWNGNSIHTSWLVTEETAQGELLTPASPAVNHVVHHAAVTHTVEHDAVTHTVEHAGVTHTVEHDAVTHTVEHDAVTTTVEHDAVTHTVTHEAVTHTVTHEAVTHEEQVVDVVEHTIPGEHHDAVAEVSHVERQWAAVSPGGAWTDSGETREVVDEPALDSTELKTAGVPAGAACPQNSDPASAVPATLAFTGVDPSLYLAGGLVLLFVGSGLTVAARRRDPKSA